MSDEYTGPARPAALSQRMPVSLTRSNAAGVSACREMSRDALGSSRSAVFPQVARGFLQVQNGFESP
jgi:hypothetical protein